MQKVKGLEQLATLAVKQIIRSNALVFTAGAGMGVDSGLPTFRGNEVTPS
jgi:NAD-dependent SIR2 family protein deacetylase